MKLLASLFMGALVAACMVASAVPAMAKDTGLAVRKVLVSNLKVVVTETTWKAGAETPSQTRGARVVRALKGGTLTLIYADGKTEKRTYKTGEVEYLEAETSASILKNEGKTEIKLYAVFLI